MPRLSARRHSLRVSKLHTHNLIEQERQVLRSPFMCVSLRKQQTVYAATLSVPCGVLLRAWRPTHFFKLERKSSFITPDICPANIASKPVQTLFSGESRLLHPFRVSAQTQRNKLRLLYRLTSERV